MADSTRGDHAETPETVPSVDAGATNGASAAVETDEADQARRGELRDSLALLIAHHPSPRNLGVKPEECTACERAVVAADRVLAARWRPPLPQPRPAGDLNALLGIDDTKRIYTEVDLVQAYSDEFGRAREGETVEWGRRYPGGQVVFTGVDRDSAESIVRPGTEIVYRLVKPWKMDED